MKRITIDMIMKPLEATLVMKTAMVDMIQTNRNRKANKMTTNMISVKILRKMKTLKMKHFSRMKTSMMMRK